MFTLVLGIMALTGITVAIGLIFKINIGLLDFGAMSFSLFGTLFYFFFIFGQEYLGDFIRLMTKLVHSGKQDDYMRRRLIEWFTQYSWCKHKMQPLPAISEELKSEFLTQSMGHLDRGILMPEMLREILLKSAYADQARGLLIRDKLVTLAKFVPTISILALIMVAVSRVSGLFQPLDLEPIGMLIRFSTLTMMYTFVISFVVLMPLSEKVARDCERRFQMHKLIIEGIYRIMRKENPFHVFEQLNALQPMEKRLSWKELGFAKEEVSHA